MLLNFIQSSGFLNLTLPQVIIIAIIFPGLSIGAKAAVEYFLTSQTMVIIFLGLAAFAVGTAGWCRRRKPLYFLNSGKINPLIGSAGVSAVPMSACVSQIEGKRANPDNYLLMHAMGPNVAEVIGSAVAAGILLAILS